MTRSARRRLILLAIALAPAAARAEYCINFAAWHVRQFGRPNYCWPTEPACQDYYRSRCLNPTYAKDCAGGCYEKPGSKPKTTKGSSGPAPGASEAARQQQLLQDQKRQEAAAADRDFKQRLQGLNTQLKAPPPEGTALRQAGGLSASGAEAARGLAVPGGVAREEQARVQAGWPGREAAPPLALKPPPPPSPPIEARVEDARPGAGGVPRWLLDAMAGTRRQLATQDQEVQSLERQVEAGEKAAAAPAPGLAVKAPAAREDEALRKAREALALARANRERTRAELERMEREAARTPASTDGAGPRGP